jgi:hypothetical protein
VTNFTSANLPAGITLSTTGLLAGTPINDASSTTFTVTASTGFASQNKAYTYRTIADNAIILLPTSTVTVPPVFSNVEFDVLSYSGIEGTLTSYYGIEGITPRQQTMATLTTTSPNLLNGNFGNVPVLAPEYRFNVQGQVASLTTLKQVNAVVSPAPVIQHSAILADVISYPSNAFLAAPPPQVQGRIVVSTDQPVGFPTSSAMVPVPTGPSSWTTRLSFSAQGNQFDMARNSNVFVAVIGSNVWRSVDYGNSWSQIPVQNIQRVSGVFGQQYQGFADPGIPGPPPLRLSQPTFGAVVSDGTSNWWAIGIGTSNAPSPAPSNYWLPIPIIRKSTDNGLTWIDSKGAIPAAEGQEIAPSPGMIESNRLFYNQDRLFYTGIQRILTGIPSVYSNAFYYADVSDTTTWTKPLELGGQGAIQGIAFSNSTAFAVGFDASSALTVCFKSTDNGTTWTTATNPNSGSRFTYTNADVFQRYGTWLLAGSRISFGNSVPFLANSDDLDAWNDLGAGTSIGNLTATTENGLTWVSGGPSSVFRTVSWTGDGQLYAASELASSLASTEFKRLYSDVTFTPSNPTLTLFIPYDASGLAFTSPTQTQYTNWQYVPIPTISLTTSNPFPGSFIYYYTAGLPRGLTLNLDASGIAASITGTSSQFSDAFQSVVLYAALSPETGGGVAALPITMRTILPTVQKQQTSAGAWTSLVRQYTLVNAAENSINGRALPATEPPLGEFTRPYPPDEVSVLPCPKC